MVVRRHSILHSEVIVLYAVVSDIDDDEKILAANGRLDIAFAVTRRKSGAFALNKEGINVDAALSGPVNEVIVDLFSKFCNAVHCYDADRCNIGITAE